MQTSSLIALIKRQAPGWSNEEIRELIDDVQLIMLSHALEFNRSIDTSTGLDHVLTTTTGIYEYEISIANGFTDDALFIESVYTTTDPEPAYNYDEDRVEDGEDVYSVPATRASVAKVIFKDDPLGNDFYIRYYKKPTSVSMQYTNLSVPEWWHIKGVRVGVLGIIEEVEHGTSRNWERFEKEVLPNFWNEMNTTIDTIGTKTGSKGY